jgi:hypothetical protein
MAYPQTRSMNTDLHAGMTDGKYKKIEPNRGGFCEETSHDDRNDMSDIWYGFHEADTVELPDGRRMAMPYHSPNAPSRACEEGI